MQKQGHYISISAEWREINNVFQNFSGNDVIFPEIINSLSGVCMPPNQPLSFTSHSSVLVSVPLLQPVHAD